MKEQYEFVRFKEDDFEIPSVSSSFLYEIRIVNIHKIYYNHNIYRSEKRKITLLEEIC